MILNCGCGYTANLYIVTKYDDGSKLQLQCCCRDLKILYITAAIIK